MNGEGNRFKGENHMPMVVNGRIKKGEYAGPGTHILKRAKLNIKPINLIDIIASIHDCEYFLSQVSKTKEEQKKKVLKSDADMVSRIGEVMKKGLDNPLNIAMTSKIMKSKINIQDMKEGSIGELMKLLKKGKLNAIRKIGMYILSSKLDAISGKLEKYPTKDIKTILQFRKKKIQEFNTKVGNFKGGSMGDGIGSAIVEIIKKILNALFGGKKGEEFDEEEIKRESEKAKREYEERNNKPEKEEKKNSCEEILSEQDIASIREFRRWSLRNHPDKVEQRGGTPEEIKMATTLYQIVSNCVDKLIKGGFSGKSRGSSCVKAMLQMRHCDKMGDTSKSCSTATKKVVECSKNMNGSGRRKKGNVKTLNGSYRGAIIN